MRCQCIAKSTQEQCKLNAKPGNKFCGIHKNCTHIVGANVPMSRKHSLSSVPVPPAPPAPPMPVPVPVSASITANSPQSMSVEPKTYHITTPNNIHMEIKGDKLQFDPQELNKTRPPRTARSECCARRARPAIRRSWGRAFPGSVWKRSAAPICKA